MAEKTAGPWAGGGAGVRGEGERPGEACPWCTAEELAKTGRFTPAGCAAAILDHAREFGIDSVIDDMCARHRTRVRCGRDTEGDALVTGEKCQLPLEGDGARCGKAATHLVRFIDEDIARVCEDHALSFTKLARAHSATISVTRAT
jgi:hypothetical protein